MCNTNYIQNLFASTSSVALNNIVIISMKRSDGELFIASLKMLTEKEANRIKDLINYFEELRTCSCTKDIVCEKHSELRKIS